MEIISSYTARTIQTAFSMVQGMVNYPSGSGMLVKSNENSQIPYFPSFKDFDKSLDIKNSKAALPYQYAQLPIEVVSLEKDYLFFKERKLVCPNGVKTASDNFKAFIKKNISMIQRTIDTITNLGYDSKATVNKD